MIHKKIPIANIYYLLCYAWRHVEERDVIRVGELEELERVQVVGVRISPYDLLGKVLAEGTFRLIRRGIDRGYRDVHENLAGIRGKIVMGETVKRALRGRGQVACNFEEMSHDVLHNRILRSTLRSLLRLPNLHSDVRAEVRSAYVKLADVTVVALNRQLFQQVHLDRNRRYYRFLMSVCRLIHEQLLVDENSGETKFTDFTEERMEKLYENFVIEFFRAVRSKTVALSPVPFIVHSNRRGAVAHSGETKLSQENGLRHEFAVSKTVIRLTVADAESHGPTKAHRTITDPSFLRWKRTLFSKRRVGASLWMPSTTESPWAAVTAGSCIRTISTNF